MNTTLEHELRDDLLDRRQRLAGAISEAGAAADLERLLDEVDGALSRLDTPEFDRCCVCGESVDAEDLASHPGMNYCLCELDDEQLDALSRDLDMAWHLQSSLLPRQDHAVGGWTVHYRYVPAGPVSGDYCDVLTSPGDDDAAHVFVGDVSGKGVAASLIMAHLSALLRSQVKRGAAVPDLLREANGHLSETIPATHFATLAAARVEADGTVELSNAGHCPPLVLRARGVEALDGTGFPLGVVDDASYDVQRTHLDPGDSLVLYSDGVIDAADAAQQRYGVGALERRLATGRDLPPGQLAQACLDDILAFENGAGRTDDITLMIVRRDA
jgi:sigma-B regulation protein RsbU (phosphoserine phosphatase)